MQDSSTQAPHNVSTRRHYCDACAHMRSSKNHSLAHLGAATQGDVCQRCQLPNPGKVMRADAAARGASNHQVLQPRQARQALAELPGVAQRQVLVVEVQHFQGRQRAVCCQQQQ